MDVEAEEFLEHFGVKGMRWGVRKSEPHPLDTKSLPDVKTSKGEILSVVGTKAPLIARGISRISPGFRDKVMRSSHFAVKNSKQQTVGEISLYKKGPKELNVVWIQTNKGHEGKGYGTAGMNAVIKEARRQKLDKVTLEVPGISPNARHIYEKLGFKSNKEQTDYDPNDIWGGLTEMTLDLKNTAKHSADDALEHFGVKGMRWGVRKSEPGARQQRKAEKAQKKWDRKAKQGFFGDYMAAAKLMNSTDVPRINNKPQYKNADFRKSSPLRDKYYKEMNDALAKRMTEAAKARVGDSPIGRREVKYKYNTKTDDIDFHITEAKHDGLEDFFFRGKLDSMGHIISLEVVEEETLQQSDDVSDFLEHYGVKGMRWGVRNADRPEASGDAVAFRGIKTKAKKGGVSALSNKELKEFNERANLEQQYHRLNPSVKKKALQFTADILLGVGKQQAMKLAGDVAAKQIANLLKK